MGSKMKTRSPPKLQPPPPPKKKGIKISRGTSRTRPHETRELSRISSDCFEYAKKSLLKSSYRKKYLPKVSYKKSRNRKFTPPKSLSLVEIRSTSRPHPHRELKLYLSSQPDIRDFRNICYNEGAVIE